MREGIGEDEGMWWISVPGSNKVTTSSVMKARGTQGLPLVGGRVQNVFCIPK